jgi:hypothetical protein
MDKIEKSAKVLLEYGPIIGPFIHLLKNPTVDE